MKLAQIVAFVPKLPFFRNDSLTLVQTGVEVGQDGIGQGLYNGMQFSGAVDPSQSESLNRMLEGQNLNGAIMVMTSVPLSAGNQSRAADIIGWCGRTYEVVRVADYAEGGSGIRQAACRLLDANPPQ